MRNHPATHAKRARAYGGALLIALEEGVGPALDCSDVYALGTRYKYTQATPRAPARTYTLDALEFRSPELTRVFYVLAGGASGARTVLNASGEPIVVESHRPGRGLSPAFREWIAAAVKSDSERATGGAAQDSLS